MAKKIICLVAALALAVSCFVVPTFAATYEFGTAEYEKYPSLNAFPYPYPAPGAALNGKVMTSRPEIKIKQSTEGYNQPTACFILNNWTVGEGAGQTVTFSTQFVPYGTTLNQPDIDNRVSIRVEIVKVDGTKEYYSCFFFDSVTFYVPSLATVNIYIRFGAYAPFPSFAFYPVLNYGDTAYPYQPYLNAYLDEQYNSGYQDGYNHGQIAGYEEGYVDATRDFDENAKVNPLRFASLKCYATAYSKIDGTTGFFDYVVTVPSTYYVNAFNDMSIEYARQYVLSACNSARPDVYWNDQNTSFTFEFSFENSLMSSFEYYSGFFGAYVDYQDGSYYLPVQNVRIEGVLDGSVVDFLATGVILGENDEIDSDLIFNYTYQSAAQFNGTKAMKVSFTFQQFDENLAADMKFVSIGTALSPSYSAGYTSGYLAGQKSNTDNEALEAAFEEGRRAGFAEGKREGLAVADNGDWLSLFTSVIEAPVVAFQSLFNFNIFGFDMRDMVTSILTICVFIVILKKVGAV